MAPVGVDWGGFALVQVQLDPEREVLQVIGLDFEQRGGFVGIQLEARIGHELGPPAVEQADAKLIADDGFTKELVETRYRHGIVSEKGCFHG
jgi:hypothetical protein